MNAPERLKELLAQALKQRTSAERENFLAEACKDQPELRSEIDSLLRAHEQAGDFLGQTIQLPTADFEPEPIGSGIGRYKLLEKIGEGGFGVVYMAEQQEPVQRKVALKVIKAGMDTREVIARFEAERQALALMDHPNIAKVLDAGATERKRPYFVMELVRGIPITDYCDQAKLSTADRLQLFIKVCQAVQHAHQRAVIHRDLKPSNILVTLHDGEPVPKVIDFGVAKALGQKLTEKTLFTAFRQMIGTPAYMSPEQAEMSGLDVDTRSDIYSLGVLLYELLTGVTPFDKEVLAKAALDEIRRMIRETEPPKPSTRLRTLGEKITEVAKRRHTEPTALSRLVRGDLDWIVMKCLEKDRQRRYETANDLGGDIHRHLGSEPIVARPPTTAYRLQKAIRRNKVACASVGMVALALVLGTIAATWQAAVATRARKDEARQRRGAQLAQKDAEAVTDYLITVFQSPDPARDGRTITVAESLDRAARRLDTDLGNQPAQRSKLQGAIGSTYIALGLHQQAIPLLENARDYYLKTFGLEHTNTLDSMNDLGFAYRHVGRLNEALMLMEQVLELRRKVLGPEHPDTLNAMNNLASLYRVAGRLGEALNLQEQVLELSRHIKGPEHPETLIVMNNLSITYRRAGRLDQALKLGEQVFELRRKVSGSEHPATLLTMNNLALSYADAGRLDEALKMQEQVLELSRKVKGPEHPETLLAMGNLAASYSDTGRLDEALKLREQVLELRRKVSGLQNPDTLTAMINLANSYFEAGRRDEALKLKEQALELCRKAQGPEHQDTLKAMGNLAVSYFDIGRRDEALTLREQQLQSCRKVLGPQHPDTIKTMHNLATSYFDTGRRNEALTLREEVLQLRRKVSGPQHPDTLMAMSALALSYFDSGRREEALRLREQVLELRRKVSGPEHPDTLTAMNHLAVSYFDTGRRDDALKLREQVLQLRRKNSGPQHPDTLTAMNDLAGSYSDTGRRDEALNLREQVLELRRKVLGPQHPDTLSAIGNLAVSFPQQGTWKEAAVDVKKIIDLQPTDHAPYHMLAPLLVALGDLQNYRQLCQKILAQFQGTTNAFVADRMAKDCLILPSSGADWEVVGQLAEAAVTAGKSQSEFPYFQCTKALAEYRLSHFAGAVDWAHKSIDNPSYPADASRFVEAYMVLAMAQHQMTLTNEARATLPKGMAKTDELAILESGAIGDGWRDWIIAHALLKEAKALINGETAAPANQ